MNYQIWGSQVTRTSRWSLKGSLKQQFRLLGRVIYGHRCRVSCIDRGLFCFVISINNSVFEEREYWAALRKYCRIAKIFPTDNCTGGNYLTRHRVPSRPPMAAGNACTVLPSTRCVGLRNISHDLVSTTYVELTAKNMWYLLSIRFVEAHLRVCR